MEAHARELLARAGVRSDISEDALHEIVSSSGSDVDHRAPSPFSPAPSEGGRSEIDNLSLPATVLAELSALQHGQGLFSSGVHGSGSVLEAVRREYEERIAQLSECVATVQHEARLAELDFGRQLREAQAAADQAKRDAAATVAAAKAGQEAAEAGAVALRDKLEAAKAEFADVSVSGGLWEELRRVPPASMSLRQHVLYKVHELVVPLQQQVDALRKQVDARDGMLLEARESSERQVRAAGHRAAIAEAREAAARDAERLATDTAQRLQTQVTELMSRVSAMADAAAAYDTAQRARKEAESAAGIAASERDSLRTEKTALAARVESLQARVDALTAERLSLVASLDNAVDARRHAETAAAAAAEAAHEATKQRENAQAALAAAATDARLSSEERVEMEVRRLREERAAGVAEAVRRSAEAAEREIATLREVRDAATAEVRDLRQRLDMLQSAYEASTAAASAALLEAQTTAAEARAAHRIRSAEVERLTTALADSNDALRAARADVDVLREQLTVAQRAYAALEVSSEKRVAVLEASHCSLQERLDVYERLEANVDDAIVSAGVAQAEGGASTALDVHTANVKRRVAQAVSLARDLAAAQRDIAQLKRQLDAAQETAASAGADATSLREQLDAVSGPQEYLISMLRARETELKTARAELSEARAGLAGSRQQVSELRAALVASEAESHKLISRTIDHDTVLTTVKAMLDSQRASDAAATAQQLAGLHAAVAGLQAHTLGGPPSRAPSPAVQPSPYAAASRSSTPSMTGPPGGSPDVAVDYRTLVAADAAGKQLPAAVLSNLAAHAETVSSTTGPPGASPTPSTRSRGKLGASHVQDLFGAETPKPQGIQYRHEQEQEMEPQPLGASGAASGVGVSARDGSTGVQHVRFAVSQVDSVLPGGDVASPISLTHASLQQPRSPGEIKVRPLVRVAGQGPAPPRWYSHTILPLAASPS